MRRLNAVFVFLSVPATIIPCKVSERAGEVCIANQVIRGPCALKRPVELKAAAALLWHRTPSAIIITCSWELKRRLSLSYSRVWGLNCNRGGAEKADESTQCGVDVNAWWAGWHLRKSVCVCTVTFSHVGYWFCLRFHGKIESGHFFSPLFKKEKKKKSIAPLLIENHRPKI